MALVAVVVLMIPISLIFRGRTSLFFRLSPYASSTGNTNLHWAAEDGRTQAVEKLLAKGADVNCRNNDGYTPLHLAGFRGRKKTVQLLIAKGANVNAREDVHGSTPLHNTAFPGQEVKDDRLQYCGGGLCGSCKIIDRRWCGS